MNVLFRDRVPFSDISEWQYLDEWTTHSVSQAGQSLPIAVFTKKVYQIGITKVMEDNGNYHMELGDRKIRIIQFMRVGILDSTTVFAYNVISDFEEPKALQKPMGH